MKTGERAREIHTRGYNCSQCVLASLSEYTGLDDDIVKSICAPFGGGMRTGEVCGAVSGALMAMGMALAKDGNGGTGTTVSACAKELQKQFKNEYGTERCAELIKAADGHRRCDEFIAYCAEKAEKIINDNK